MMLSKIDKELNDRFLTCAKYVKQSHGKYVTQTKILQILVDNDSVLPQKELQKKLEIKSGSMSEIIIKLEKRGLIKRVRNPEDKRAFNIILTKEGLESLRKHQEKEHDSSTLYVALSKTEKKQLSDMLGKLISNWTSEDPNFLKETSRTRHGHKK